VLKFKIVSKFLENLDGDMNSTSNRALESIKQNTAISAGESVVYYELKKHKA
jgi:hypothetical protein